MPRVVVVGLPAANQDTAAGYDVRLGPLAFVCLADSLDRTLGEALEASGPVLTPTERRARPLKLVLPVRGASTELDPKLSGYRLRRQLEQLLENQRWLAGGLYFYFAADPEAACWVRVGGGTLQESDPSIVFGEWTLELTDCYVVGRPARQRLGRRLELVDRRTGLAPLDTRGLLYSTDHAAQALPARPLVVPGDVASLLLTRNRPSSDVAVGPQRGVRRLWREAAALDGDVGSFLPDDAVLPDPARQYLDLEDVGSVRAWDTSSSTVDLGDPTHYTGERDTTPELYAWERLLGSPASASSRELPLAVDNGACRLIWLGRSAGQGLAVEYWDDVAGHYVRLCRVAGAAGVREVNLVELTTERAVLELRGDARALRAILQRGWYGPRLEAYNDAPGGTALLELAPEGGAPAVAAQAPAWVEALTTAGRSILWAKGRDSDARTAFAAGGAFLNGAGVAYASTGQAIVTQIGTPAGPTAGALASLAIADARSVPVLVTR